MALETMNVLRATSRPSTSLGRDRESDPENMPVEANSTKEGISLISNSSPEFNIMAVIPVALLSSFSTSPIWIDWEDSVPAGQMPRATVGAWLAPFRRARPAAAVATRRPVRLPASGATM